MFKQIIYGVQLQPCGQICYFTAGEWPDLSRGDRVVVRIDRGEALAEIVRIIQSDQQEEAAALPEIEKTPASVERDGKKASLYSSDTENAEDDLLPAEAASVTNTLSEAAEDAPGEEAFEEKKQFFSETLQWEVWEDDEQQEEGFAVEPGFCHDPASPNIQDILRPARDDDLARAESNQELSRKAHLFCMQRSRHHNLSMKMVQAEYLLDRSKIIFYFTAPSRIDFRELVKDLVREFRTRIELRQIGVRHEAQMVGATGNCGMVCCCRRYMRRFAPVTIKMAKEQNLFLNPAKISGTCGRLLCCLAFEQEGYEEFHRRCPKISKKYTTNRGVVKVLRSSIFRNTLSLLPEEGEEFEVTLDEWQAMEPVRQGQAQQVRRASVQDVTPPNAPGEKGKAAVEGNKPKETQLMSMPGFKPDVPQPESHPAGEEGSIGEGALSAREAVEREEHSRTNKAGRKERGEKPRPRKGQLHTQQKGALPDKQLPGESFGNRRDGADNSVNPEDGPQKREIMSAGLSRFLAATGEEE